MIRHFLLIAVLCLSASCRSRTNIAPGKVTDQAELERATRLASELHQNMTFEEVSKVVPLVGNEMGVSEHGGIWFKVPIGDNYYMQLRFSRPFKGQGYESMSLNLPPQVKRNRGEQFQ